MKRRREPLPRLIDLHVDWPLQYVGETTQFDPADYPPIAARLGQVQGYLQATSAAVVACFRSAADWARRADPWAALGSLLARVEAEFPGRVLADPADHARWRADSEGLTWAVIGVEGFDALVRATADLDRLPALFARGVRVFQPVHGPSGLLGGSTAEDDARGLTDLGRSFLARLEEMATPAGPCPLLDLAHMNGRTIAEALDWLEADAGRARRLVPIFSHGGLGDASPRALRWEFVGRLRCLGGHIGLSVGPPHVTSTDELRAAIEHAAALPFSGEAGHRGLAIGSNFLGLSAPVVGLEDAESVANWLMGAFGPRVGRTLVQENAGDLIALATGVAE